jgi:hypothetical protein
MERPPASHSFTASALNAFVNFLRFRLAMGLSRRILAPVGVSTKAGESQLDLSQSNGISVENMLLEWALAERHEWTHPPAELCRKIDAGEVLDPSEQEMAIGLFAEVERRGPEVAFFRRLGADWFATEFPVAALGNVRLHRHWALNHWALTPGSAEPYPRTVAEFARRSDVPRSFDPDGRRELLKGYRPVCVATSRDGPWHIAEGSHRSHGDRSATPGCAAHAIVP